MPVFVTFFNSRLEYSSVAYNQTVAPGVTRPLHSPAGRAEANIVQ